MAQQQVEDRDTEEMEEGAPFDPREALGAVADFARESPHAAVAGAFALGFLLGGGLTPRLLASMALFAGRRYVAEAARDAIEGAVRERIEQAVSASS